MYATLKTNDNDTTLNFQKECQVQKIKIKMPTQIQAFNLSCKDVKKLHAKERSY